MRCKMENQYIIKGGNPLHGEVVIGGAKNAALGILAAAIMTDETVTIDNLPNVRDINVLLTAIESIGATVKRLGPHESLKLGYHAFSSPFRGFYLSTLGIPMSGVV